MLYFYILLVIMSITTANSIIYHVATGNMSLVYSIFAPMMVNAYVLILFGLLTLVMRIFIPKDFWFKDLNLFNVSKREIKLYDKMQIKSWKEKVPEMGKTGGFPKDSIRSLDKEYIHKFISETCFAEWLHVLSAFLGITALYVFPVEQHFFVIPIVITNLLLHLPLAIIQRYNRYRLNIIYKRKNKSEIRSDAIV